MFTAITYGMMEEGVGRKRYQTKDYMLSTCLSCFGITNVSTDKMQFNYVSLDWTVRFRHHPVSKYQYHNGQVSGKGVCHLMHW
jgi:hypothetical protein